MVAMEQFPMFRLATLLARQLSSPFASRIKNYAVRSPRFRTTVCMGMARGFAAAEQRFRLGVLRLGGVTGPPPRAPPLSDNEAVEIGSNLLGEIIVFVLGALIMIFELNRQAEKQEDKVLAERSQWVALALSLEELAQELKMQQEELDRLQAALQEMAPSQTFPPPPQHRD